MRKKDVRFEETLGNTVTCHLLNQYRALEPETNIPVKSWKLGLVAMHMCSTAAAKHLQGVLPASEIHCCFDVEEG